jgi:trehalose 6-phosphate synthase/phosphatase
MTTNTEIIASYQRAKKRLLLFDYDGTLREFHNKPEEARPTPQLLGILDGLTKDDKNMVAIVSGRDRKTLEQWFRNLPVTLVAEHGAFIRHPNKPWVMLGTVDTSWKARIRPLMEASVATISGSSIEEKETALVWHYRAIDTPQARAEAQALTNKLRPVAATHDISVKPGSKIVEARQSDIHKGQIPKLLHAEDYDFALAAGDDVTDEDLFDAMPKLAHTIKIGVGKTKAISRIADPSTFLALLQSLSA